MKRADLLGLFRRIDRAFRTTGNRYGAVGMSQFVVKDLVVREVNRALREARLENNVCVDCPFASTDDLLAYSERLEAPRGESATAEDDDRASPPDDEETT